MVDDFEERLKTTADQIKAEKKRQQEAHEARVRRQEELVAKINNAIREWNERIEPAISKIVARTNELLRDVGIQLDSNAQQRQPQIPPNQVGPGIPALPLLIITRQTQSPPQPQPQMVRRGNVMVPAGRVRPRAPHVPPQPNLRIGVDERGEIAVSCQNYIAKADPPVPSPAAQFSEDAAKNAIGQFVATGLRGQTYEAIGVNESLDTATPGTNSNEITNGETTSASAHPGNQHSTLPPDSKARTAIGRAVLQNELTIELIATALLAFLDDKVASLHSELPNSTEAQAFRDQEITDCSNLREAVGRFLDATKRFSEDLSHEPTIVDTSTSFATGLGRWWEKRHEDICQKTFDMGLFSLGVSACVLAGAGGILAAIIPGVLIGGQPVVESLRAWSRAKKQK